MDQNTLSNQFKALFPNPMETGSLFFGIICLSMIQEKYLIVLNPNLIKIDQNKLKILAIDSIIKEKINRNDFLLFIITN